MTEQFSQTQTATLPPSEGWSGRWTRRAEVETQIAALQPADVWPRLAIIDKTDPRYIQTEALVNLVRRLYVEGRTETAKEIAGEVVLRAGRIAGGMARQLYPRDMLRREDLVDAVQETILMALLNPAQEFLEASFGFFVRRRAQSIYQQMQIEARREQAIGEMPGLTDDEGDDIPQRELFIEQDHAEQIVAHIALRATLAQLPPNIQQAVYLVHIEGYHIESGDPTEMTVSRILGVTGRSVRNYLRRGEAALREWHEQETGRDG